MRPVHELVEEAVDADPYLPQRLTEAIDAAELPPCYDKHPVVRSSVLPVLPYALYTDGLPYSMVDSVVGIWLVSLLTGARQMIAVVRKKMLCQCGCRGRDTFYAIMSWLRWSLQVCASGRHPTTRHDRARFFPKESFREEVAGSPLRVGAAILYIKGDWAEFCERFGFPTSAHALRPCFCCSVPPGPQMYSPAGISQRIQPWRINTDTDFERAFSRCERFVVLDPVLHQRISAVLFYDKRPAGSHGRALLADIPEANLMAGDRLEPSGSLPDPGDFELLSVFPCTVTFWKVSETSLAHFRSPLWSPDIGLTPSSTPAVDLLHTLYLGPMLTWTSCVFWAFLDANIWGQNSPSEFEGKVVTLGVLKTELFNFYSRYDSAHPSAKATRLSELTPKMVGLISGNRRLKFKAMETFFLLQFWLFFMPLHLGTIADGEALLAAGQIMNKFVSKLKSWPVRLTFAWIGELLDLWKRFCSVAEDLELFTPKVHLMYHLILRSAEHGNPWRYHTFLDEGLNRVLKRTLRLCHQCAFESLALIKINDLLRRHGGQRHG